MRGKVRVAVGASLACGLAYPLLWAWPLAPAAMIAAKGTGVALLALAAALSARGPDGWLLVLVLALGAAGDVLLEIRFAAGAALFATGHVAAILLYRRNRREGTEPFDRVVAAMLVIAAAALPALLLHGRPETLTFSAYGLLLGAMAASAWLSRFPRNRVALGALLFLASDMLIALRLGQGALWLSLPIWLLYYFGQLLIFVGVSSSPSEMGRGTTRSVVEG